jgi:hypothetical protein
MRTLLAGEQRQVAAQRAAQEEQADVPARVEVRLDAPGVCEVGWASRGDDPIVQPACDEEAVCGGRPQRGIERRERRREHPLFRPGRAGARGQATVTLADGRLRHDERELRGRDQCREVEALRRGRGERAGEPAQGEAQEADLALPGCHRCAQAELEDELLEDGAQTSQVEGDKALTAPRSCHGTFQVARGTDEPDVLARFREQAHVAAHQLRAADLPGGDEEHGAAALAARGGRAHGHPIPRIQGLRRRRGPRAGARGRPGERWQRAEAGEG